MNSTPRTTAVAKPTPYSAAWTWMSRVYGTAITGIPASCRRNPQARASPADAKHLVAAIDNPAHDRFDARVQPRNVATAGEDADPHAERLPCWPSTRSGRRHRTLTRSPQLLTITANHHAISALAR